MQPGKRRFRLIWVARGLVLLGVVLVMSLGPLVRWVGGASEYKPQQLARSISPAAMQLIRQAWQGITPSRLMDYHTHVVGLGTNGSGCSVHPHMLSWWHPVSRLKFHVYASAAGVYDPLKADQQFVERLVQLVQHIPSHGRHLILAFDQHLGLDGQPILAKTEFHVPNSYILKLSQQHPRLLVPAISIHPYRADAVQRLERWAAKGARVVKWLPNAMGIDPSHRRCDPFYRAMRRLDMILLSHAGEEKAVEAEEDQQLGNPLLLRRPLDLGVKVIVSHCASLGQNQDLDHPQRALRDNFDLFLRLMDQPRYRGRVFGEISAMTQFNRLPRPITTLLRRKELHGRLVNGSDYPLPAINIIIRTSKLEQAGLITAQQRTLLNEIYDYNPLLFDLVTKRTLREPQSGNAFPPAMFMIHPQLDPAPPRSAMAHAGGN